MEAVKSIHRPWVVAVSALVILFFAVLKTWPISLPVLMCFYDQGPGWAVITMGILSLFTAAVSGASCLSLLLDAAKMDVSTTAQLQNLTLSPRQYLVKGSEIAVKFGFGLMIFALADPNGLGFVGGVMFLIVVFNCVYYYTAFLVRKWSGEK